MVHLASFTGTDVAQKPKNIPIGQDGALRGSGAGIVCTPGPGD